MINPPRVWNPWRVDHQKKTRQQSVSTEHFLYFCESKDEIPVAPLVSIVIPTYNSALVLREAIESVRMQNYAEKELLIIDGGSYDNTGEIVKQYENEIAVYVTEEDKGIYDAMNKGICLASGDYLYFMGSDDRFANEQVLETIMTEADRKMADVIYGNVSLKSTGRIYDGEFDFKRLAEKNICHQAIFFKRSIFSKLGMYSLSYPVHADYEFNLRWMARRDVKKVYMPIIVANYNDKGTSTILSDQFRTDLKSLIRKSYPIHRLLLLKIHYLLLNLKRIFSS